MPTMRRLYTIGYGNQTFAPLLQRLEGALREAGSTRFLVFDVRARPRSWCGDLTYPCIAKNLHEAGHDYRWCRNLGNNGDREHVRLSNQRLGLAELRVALEGLTPDEELVLLCAEREPRRCHRSAIAQLAVETFEVGLRVIHL